MSKRLKSLLVIIGAVVFSTLGIQATDQWRGIGTDLTGSANLSNGPCGAHEELLLMGDRSLCFDVYEASPAAECPVVDPKNALETNANLSTSLCQAATQPEVQPWRYVTLTEAQQLCGRAGKRLPTNEEWYKAAVGLTDIEACAIDGLSEPTDTGTTACAAPTGIHDLVGNVWEWIDESVTDGVYNERALPETGYISAVDQAGVALETDLDPQANYGDDYAWTNLEGSRGIIRGGFYGSGADAGLFTINAAVAFDFQATGVGFRCVRDVQ